MVLILRNAKHTKANTSMMKNIMDKDTTFQIKQDSSDFYDSTQILIKKRTIKLGITN